MKTTISTLAAVALLSGGAVARAEGPRITLPPIPADPATMALAQKAVGKTCVFKDDKIGPQIAGLSNLPNTGQGIEAEGFTFVRKNGPHRVMFLAYDVENRCKVLAVHPLPPYVRGEEFLQCEVQNPDPMINKPLATGPGLRQHGKLVTFLEVGMKAKTLTPRASDDKRIKCFPYETGE